MRRRVGLVLLLPLLLAAGCGDEKKRPAGGTVEVLSYLYPVTLDPGQAYGSESYAPVLLMHRPLYTYLGNRREPVPDLAAGRPQVAADGRAVTVAIKHGVRFGGPVDREVVAGDVRNAIERGFLPSVANPYVSNYLSAIAGIDAFTSGRRQHISGIELPDSHTIRFRLTRPEGRLVSEALALPVTAPVPAEVSAKADSETPSSYDRQAVPTGPYRVAERGEVRLVLERNPDWSEKTDARQPGLERIVWRKASDLDIASRQVLQGRSRLFGPGPPPSPAVLKDILGGRYPGQFQSLQVPNFVGFALNTRRPPFDDPDARRAVFAGVDRAAILQSVGGDAAGELATHLIPPGVPGHDEAGGARGPGADLLRGGTEVARRYLSRAPGATSRQIDLVSPPGLPVGEVMRAELEEVGFDVHLIAAPPGNPLCTGTAKGANICFQPWSIDFFDAQSLLEPPFSGRTAGVRGSPNLTGLEDAEVDAAIARARVTNDPARRARAWAGVDRLLMDRAVFLPLTWQKNPLIHSKNVATEQNPWLGWWDLNLTSLR